jgi:7,8-dihydroneopterin aldolase/epimerase/oxygenase
MDKILMENMCFYGYHGVLAEEKTLGQKFILDTELYLPLQKAGLSDDLKDTANYGAVYNIIRDIVTKEKFNLLEGLGERITAEIFSQTPLVQRIVLRIKKPEAPIDGIFDYVGIEIERDRP